MVKWHLRRVGEPLAIAMRMFMYWDAVTPDEARTALGDGLSLETLLAAGVLMKTAEGGIRSPYLLRLAGALFILSDDVNDGGEAVMGPGTTTRGLALVALPHGRVTRALAGIFDPRVRADRGRLRGALSTPASRVIDERSLGVAYTGAPAQASGSLCLICGHLDNARAIAAELGEGPGRSLERLLAAG